MALCERASRVSSHRDTVRFLHSNLGDEMILRAGRREIFAEILIFEDGEKKSKF